MLIKTFISNRFKENTYVVYDDSKECVIIDCGGQGDENATIAKFIDNEGLKVKHILNTHCHLDHTLGNAYFSSLYGISPEVNEKEQPLVEMTHYQALALGMEDDEVAEFTPLYTLNEGEIVKFGNTELTVLHTPGHSPGGVCLYSSQDSILFSGDTIMRHSIGASNLPGGRSKALMRSVKRILELPADTTIYSGHGEVTTVGEEIEFGEQQVAKSVRE